jgi:hypothetical protein
MACVRGPRVTPRQIPLQHGDGVLNSTSIRGAETRNRLMDQFGKQAFQSLMAWVTPELADYLADQCHQFFGWMGLFRPVGPEL